MDTCLFEGRQICAYDLKNKYNEYDTELRIKWKRASQKKELFCEDCKTVVELRAGDVNIPHFAHLDANRNCFYDYESKKETEEHREGKKILSKYFKDKYPDAVVKINYRHKNKKRSDIFIEFRTGEKLVVEYQRTDLTIPKWEEKHEFYFENNINDIWILSSKENEKKKREDDDHDKRISFFNEFLCVVSKDGIAKFLNTDKCTITLVSKMEYKDPNGDIIESEFFHMEYKLYDVLITAMGNIICDFNDKLQAKKEAFDKKCSDNIEKKKQKEIEEEKYTESLRKQYYERINQNKINFVLKYDSNNENNFQTKTNNSRQDDITKVTAKVGTCKKCGIVTSEWAMYDNKDNSCVCKRCGYGQSYIDYIKSSSNKC